MLPEVDFVLGFTITAAAVLVSILALLILHEELVHFSSLFYNLARDFLLSKKKQVSPPSFASSSYSPATTTRQQSPSSTSSPYNAVAETYDSSFCDTVVGHMLRLQTWKVLDSAFVKAPSLSSSSSSSSLLLSSSPTTTFSLRSSINMPVLEMSCGTGEDTLWLASKHVHVLATDSSEGMLAIARAKCQQQSPSSSSSTFIPKDCQPIFQILDAQNLEESSFAPGHYKFSGAFSNFGGLNNVDPQGVVQNAKILAKLLQPGAKVVLVVMGRCCLVETVYYLGIGKFQRALRRLQSSPTKGISVKIGKSKHKVYFHSLTFIQDAFLGTGAFRTVQRRAIGLFLPPSLWSKSASRKVPTAVLSLLSTFDMLLGRLWPFFYLGDHYLVEFERVNVDHGEITGVSNNCVKTQ